MLTILTLGMYFRFYHITSLGFGAGAIMVGLFIIKRLY